MSILPEIIEVAEQHGLLGSYQNVSGRTDEKRVNCPFCPKGDRKRKLYINSAKNTFKCFRCGEGGGVLRFMSLLTGDSETEVVDRLKEEHGYSQNPNKPKRKKHPAENLNSFQLHELGFHSPKPDWFKRLLENPEYTKRVLDYIWAEWQSLIHYELAQSYKHLSLGITCGVYLKTLEKVTKRSRELGFDLLTPVLSAYNSKNLKSWAKEGQELAMLYLLPPTPNAEAYSEKACS